MKGLAQAMCVVMALAGLPQSSWASGDKATEAEDAKYAALEAASPEAASFEGGDSTGILVGLILIALLIYAYARATVYAEAQQFVDQDHMTDPRSDRAGGPAPIPTLFR